MEHTIIMPVGIQHIISSKNIPNHVIPDPIRKPAVKSLRALDLDVKRIFASPDVNLSYTKPPVFRTQCSSTNSK